MLLRAEGVGNDGEVCGRLNVEKKQSEEEKRELRRRVLLQ